MVLKHRAQDEGQDQRGGLVAVFLHQETHDPEKDHHPDVEDRIAEAVAPQQAEKEDDGEKEDIGNLYDLNP